MARRRLSAEVMRGTGQLVLSLLLCTSVRLVCATPEAEGGTKPDAVSGGENKILVPGQQGYGVLNAAGYRKLNQIKCAESGVVVL
jgi:hypothetical protein